jgi:integrase
MRYESVAGVRNLYVDHGRKGSPYVVRWKANGKLHDLVLGVMKQKDAITKRDEHFAQPGEERERGAPVKCGEAFDTWIKAGLRSRGSGKMKETTLKRYRSLWKQHGKQVLARVRVRDVTVDHIILVLDRMEAKNRSTNNMYVMLSSFFHAMTMEPYRYRSSNPVARLGTKKPEAPDSDAVSEEAVMTREEIETVIASLPSRWEIHRRVRADLIRVAYLTGLRLSEVLGLVWSAVDLKEGEIDVERQLAVDYKSDDPATWFATVKGNKARLNSTARVVPLDDEAWQLLRDYRSWALAQGLYRGETGLVFPTAKHTPLRQNEISDCFSTAVEASGLTRYPWTFHCLRHSFASLIFDEGGAIEEVARLLGNSVEVASKRYVHLMDRTSYNETYRARRRAAGER